MVNTCLPPPGMVSGNNSCEKKFALNQMKVGVIGYGYWGPNLLRNLTETADAEVTWCSDKRPDRRALVKRRYPSIQITDNVDEMLDDPKLDAVVIATPVQT